MLAAILIFLLCMCFIMNFGIGLYAIPYHILTFSECCIKSDVQLVELLGYVLLVIGWTLHVLVRVIWYGIFIALGSGIVYLIGYSVITGLILKK